jgi:hypothetical protein
MTEKGHNKEGAMFYRNTKQGEHYWKREKTLESMRKIKDMLGDNYTLDYIDSHFFELVDLIDMRERYDHLFKRKVYFNKEDNQIYLLHFLTNCGFNKFQVQVEAYGKNRGNYSCSELYTTPMKNLIKLINNHTLVPLDVSVRDIKNEWDELTDSYYEELEKYEIKIHNRLIDKLFSKFSKEIGNEI